VYVTFLELKKKLKVLVAFMKKCEIQFDILNKKIFEVWNVEFQSWPPINNQPLEIFEQVQTKIGSEIQKVKNEDAENPWDPTALDIIVGSTHSYSKSGLDNGMDDKDDNNDLENLYSRSSSASDDVGHLV
jgi:hypothetical protein